MASNWIAEQLTRAHHREQIAIRARAMAAITERIHRLHLWDISHTWPDVEGELEALIEAARAESAAAAANYYKAFREAEKVSGLYVPRLATAWISDIVPTLRATTLATAINVGAIAPAIASTAVAVAPAVATASVLTITLGVATRLILNAGRDTIIDTIEDDDHALGYSRVTSRNPCSFCGMLASRGPVYKSKRTATWSASGRKYHWRCACSAEPRYSRDADWPADGRAWQAIWERTTKDTQSPDEARRAFRRAVEAGASP